MPLLEGAGFASMGSVDHDGHGQLRRRDVRGGPRVSVQALVPGFRRGPRQIRRVRRRGGRISRGELAAYRRTTWIMFETPANDRGADLRPRLASLVEAIDQALDPTDGSEPRSLERRCRHVTPRGHERRRAAPHRVGPGRLHQAAHRTAPAVGRDRRAAAEVDTLGCEPRTAGGDGASAVQREEPRGVLGLPVRPRTSSRAAKLVFCVVRGERERLVGHLDRASDPRMSSPDEPRTPTAERSGAR